ncbi:unnamed protein product [Triticum turgidum subsp. durum]|uniref:non-specific serine/threonine protein kinase n=1 Tax=Triticum turgidum subsp. durum TaxID=4567 RepID=A0A9R1A9C4_TRITD|nr:unnamed protein product [Triticum turgidum subsp. durum]
MEITNNFAPEQKLGSGTFGVVYKGVLKDRMIAVKKLRFIPDIDDKQFKNECELLRRLKHQNIVQLVGFCNETEKVAAKYEGRIVVAEEIHRALCLEFVPNGNLGKFLSEQRHILNWNLCFKIIKGISEGLKYLHDVPINHLDLKPDNILLDDKMIPKIADFGISRLVGTKNTVKTLTPLGTIGYMPPEFIKRQIISKEFDIFSLGVIIIKILTVVMEDQSIYFTDDRECIEHVHSYWKKKLQGMPGYESLEADCKQVRTCIEIAVVCMDEDPRRRPTMKYIVHKLNKLELKENSRRSSPEEHLKGAISRYNAEAPTT